MKRLTAISTFSGCGGSSLGLKSAGFEVLAASEFIEAAAEVYRLNSEGTPIETRDIRSVTGKELMKLAGVRKGEVDVLEGSPPCSSFSQAGIREDGWGEVKIYSDGAQRTDDLFFEFARLVSEIQPRAFIAENVVGLSVGKAVGYLRNILEALAAAGYNVDARIVKAHLLGVAQKRERIIFIGIRKDLKQAPIYPKPQQRQSIPRDALEGLTEPGEYKLLSEGGKIRQVWDLARPGDHFDKALSRLTGKPVSKYFTHAKISLYQPIPTVTATSQTTYHHSEPRSIGIGELKRLSGFEDSFKLTGSFARQWERIGRAVPPPMMKAVALSVREVLES